MAGNTVSMEDYLKAREASIAEEQQKENNQKIYRKGYRKGFNKGHFEGLKKGFIAGAIATILLSGTLVLGYNGVKGFVEDINTSNVSVEYGYNAVRSGTRPAQEPGAYWYDYYDIASEYDSENMDFDSFVYGAFNKIGWNKSSTLNCMNHLFSDLHQLGYTEYSSFDSYCSAKGACKVVDGKLVVDTDKYKEIIIDYIQTLNELEEKQQEVESFKQGK